MEQLYSIADIAAAVDKTPQSLYKFIKRNQEFINSNCVSKGRNKFYNQAVMDRFLEYYGISARSEASNTEQPTQDTPQDAPQKTDSVPDEEISLREAKARIKALEAENAELRARLAASETERKEADNRLGMALLTLQQEKEEKRLLLPPPKKSFFETVKAIFSSNNNKDAAQS